MSGRFYVYFTSRPNGNIEVWEYRRSLADPNVADPATRPATARRSCTPRTNHNGGQLQWRENRLWVGTGDGGGGGDPTTTRRTRTRGWASCCGSTRVAAPWRSPRIGLRNPWRFSFDRGGAGR